MSEANVKTNKMVSTKWTYHKEQSFANNCFIFWKILFHFKTSYKELIWCTNHQNVHIHTFWKRWSFIWRCFLLVSILKSVYFEPCATSRSNVTESYIIKINTFSMHVLNSIFWIRVLIGRRAEYQTNFWKVMVTLDTERNNVTFWPIFCNRYC